jgi:hypothetical protein
MSDDRECSNCNALTLALDEANKAVRVSRARGVPLQRYRCPVGEGYHVGAPARRDPLSGEYRR